MADKTRISWTDATWNPVRGCSRVSKGCENCYAEKIAFRFSGAGLPYEGLTKDGRWNGTIKLVPEVLDQPIRWRKPRRIFVNSMSDLFHDGVPDEFIDRVFAVMALSPRHTFQILTKRPERMRAYCASNDTAARVLAAITWAIEETPLMASLRWDDSDSLDGLKLSNVWLGVSAENQETADERIPILLDTPAAVRFVSAEPLLGPIRFKQQNPDGNWPPDVPQPDETWLAHSDWPDDFDYWQTKSAGLDWVIVGGESGPGARPCDVEWIRSIVSQCHDASVPCFVKQIGSRPFLEVAGNESDADVSSWFGGARIDWDDNWEAWTPKLKRRKGDDPAEWPADLRVQDFPMGSD